MALFDSSIFHGGSITVIARARRCSPNASRTTPSHG